jgi:hypothetical protein
MADPKPQSWSLEVVRGANVGRRFALERGETILGNAPNGSPSINLADQEGNAPRRMAARQAKIELRNGNPVVADLESPGGTFVNRQRVLPGKGRPLELDDVIQLGSVQLRVVSAGQTAAKPAPTTDPTRPFVIILPFGSTCRSWDDFLAVSAQKWNELRQELVSGRLAGMLASQGLSAFAPDPNAPGTPDDRLDAWLGSLPSTKSAAPELAIHPKVLNVRASSEGSTTERTITITNAGYRILRGAVTVEPAGMTWVRVEPTAPFAVVDELHLRVQVTTPSVVTETLAATLAIATNGGNGKVLMTLERPGEVASSFHVASFTKAQTGRNFIDALAAISATKRPVFGFLSFAAIGLILLVLGKVWPGQEGAVGPEMTPTALLFAILGAVAGGVLAGRRGTTADVPAGTGSGAVAGVITAALVVAFGRSVASVAGLGIEGVIAWGVLGAALAELTLAVVPHRNAKESNS